MPFVNAKCTNCGAGLEVDSTKEAAICNYCGAAYIVEKAINNYQVENHNTIHAQVVNIYGEQKDTVPISQKINEYIYLLNQCMDCNILLNPSELIKMFEIACSNNPNSTKLKRLIVTIQSHPTKI